MASLYTLETIKNKMTPEEKIVFALNAAVEFDSGVGPPFKILSV